MTQMSQTARLIGQGVENLDAHGIPNIQRAKSSYRKCFWILAFLTGLSIFTFHCVQNVHQFKEFDITVNSDLRYDAALRFPAVTICNLNPVKNSTLSNFTDLDDLLGSPDTDILNSININTWISSTQQTTTMNVPTPRPTKV